jgi:hypothetical protein
MIGARQRRIPAGALGSKCSSRAPVSPVGAGFTMAGSAFRVCGRGACVRFVRRFWASGLAVPRSIVTGSSHLRAVVTPDSAPEIDARLDRDPTRGAHRARS